MQAFADQVMEEDLAAAEGETENGDEEEVVEEAGETEDANAHGDAEPEADEDDNRGEAEDEDDRGKIKRATKKLKRDPYEFKVPGERARLAGGRRKKRFWTDDEIELLLEGVRTYVIITMRVVVVSCVSCVSCACACRVCRVCGQRLTCVYPLLRHGLGCWAKILSEYEFAPGRTSVDLKVHHFLLL